MNIITQRMITISLAILMVIVCRQAYQMGAIDANLATRIGSFVIFVAGWIYR